MQSPVDYPINDQAHSVEFSMDELSYAALLDRMDTCTPDIEAPMIDAPVFSLDQFEYPIDSDQPMRKPLASLAQSLLARNHEAGNISPVFSRWSRVLR